LDIFLLFKDFQLQLFLIFNQKILLNQLVKYAIHEVFVLAQLETEGAVRELA